MQILTHYLLAAILTWLPVRSYFVPYGETEAEAKTRLESIASDLSSVTLDPVEPPAFAGDEGRMKTALLLASIGSFETSYQTFVQEGKCNQPGYVPDRRGSCDGGHAFSFWQIHVFGGGYVLGDGGALLTAETYGQIHPGDETIRILRGPDLISDRKSAIRVAERLVRSSLRQYHSLCAFTGESCEPGRHPKADVRLERAQAYLRSHPFTNGT